MTVRDIYERGIRDLPAMEQLRLARLILEQLTDGEPTAGQDLNGQIRRNTPSNSLLLDLAARHGPPQTWWDEDDDPTASSEGK